MVYLKIEHIKKKRKEKILNLVNKEHVCLGDFIIFVADGNKILTTIIKCLFCCNMILKVKNADFFRK